MTSRKVYTLAYRLTGDRGEAEDVAQEAYLRAFRSLKGFREDARFETWLHRIVVNTAMTSLRRRGRLGDLSLDEPDAPERPAPRTADREQQIVDRDALKAAMLELPAGLRAALVLQDVYDLPVAEVARHLGIAVGAAKVRVHRARRKLKELLTEGDER